MTQVLLDISQMLIVYSVKYAGSCIPICLQSKNYIVLRLSDRLLFSVLTTVLTFVYTLYLHFSLHLMGHYWYIISAPLATFIVSYFFGIRLIKGRAWLFFILPLSGALTLASHFLNLLILCLYLLVSGFYWSDVNAGDGFIGFLLVALYRSLFVMVYGILISLYTGGLVSVLIFLLSGTVTILLPAKFKKEKVSKETLLTDDKKNQEINGTTENSS